VLTAHKPQVARELYRSGQYTKAIAATLGVSRASLYRHLGQGDGQAGRRAGTSASVR